MNSGLARRDLEHKIDPTVTDSAGKRVPHAFELNSCHRPNLTAKPQVNQGARLRARLEIVPVLLTGQPPGQSVGAIAQVDGVNY